MGMDAFALLGLPRRAALDEAALRQAYTSLSRTAHPDHGGSETQASALNAAYEVLRQPERRLRHLLELAGPEEAAAWRTVPLDEGMMQTFMDLGDALEKSAAFLERKQKATSALAKALLTAEEMQHRESLEAIGMALQERRDAMESALGGLDASLSATPDLPTWQALAAAQARFAYVAKWQAQIRERLLALM